MPIVYRSRGHNRTYTEHLPIVNRQTYPATYLFVVVPLPTSTYKGLGLGLGSRPIGRGTPVRVCVYEYE